MNDVIESKTSTEIIDSTGTVNTGTVNTGTVNTGTVNTGTVNTGTVNTGTVKGNIVGTLAYLGGILAAILLLLLEKDNKFVRFHAMQSAATFVAIFVFSIVIVIIPIIGWILSPLIWLSGFILYIFLMYKAYQGEVFKIPVLGDFVAKQVGI